jgi:hypothetical protein
MKIQKEFGVTMTVLIGVSVMVLTTTTSFAVARTGSADCAFGGFATQHGDASKDCTGKPADPNCFGEQASKLAQDGSGRGLGDHAGNFDVVGQPPYDQDGENGRKGVGNNFGDGPSGHAEILLNLGGQTCDTNH